MDLEHGTHTPNHFFFFLFFLWPVYKLHIAKPWFANFCESLDFFLGILLCSPTHHVQFNPHSIVPMATIYSVRHDSTQGVPPAKRRKDESHLVDKKQHTTSIVQHAFVMANLISFISHPLDVARLLIAADRFKAPIMAQVSSICFTQHHDCNTNIMKLAIRFCHLQSCVIECTNPNRCASIGRCIKDLPRFTLSLQHLSLPHVRQDAVFKMLGSRDRNLLMSLRITSCDTLPFLPSLQRLQLRLLPPSLCFGKQLADDLPLLEELIIGPHCKSDDDVYKYPLILQDFVGLHRLSVCIHGTAKLQSFVLPPNLQQLTVTPLALQSLKGVVCPNMTSLSVLLGDTRGSYSTIGALNHIMPKLRSLHVAMAASIFRSFLTVDPDFVESMTELTRINTRILTSFPECWPYLKQLSDSGRQIEIIPDGTHAYIDTANSYYHDCMPPFDNLSFVEVALSSVPQESLKAATRLWIMTPSPIDWTMLSNDSTFSCLTHLSMYGVETVALTQERYSLAPLKSLKKLSLNFVRFRLNCTQKLGAITKLIQSVSSNQLQKLKILISDVVTEWYPTLAASSVSSVRSVCMSWPALLQKNPQLQYFRSDIPVIGLDDAEEAIFHQHIAKIRTVIWRGKDQAFNNDHYFHLMDHMIRHDRLTKLQKLNVSIIQPCWFTDSKSTKCFCALPPDIIDRHAQDDPHWECHVETQPCVFDPKYLLIKLKLKDGVTNTSHSDVERSCTILHNQ